MNIHRRLRLSIHILSTVTTKIQDKGCGLADKGLARLDTVHCISHNEVQQRIKGIQSIRKLTSRCRPIHYDNSIVKRYCMTTILEMFGSPHRYLYILPTLQYVYILLHYAARIVKHRYARYHAIQQSSSVLRPMGRAINNAYNLWVNGVECLAEKCLGENIPLEIDCADDPATEILRIDGTECTVEYTTGGLLVDIERANSKKQLGTCISRHDGLFTRSNFRVYTPVHHFTLLIPAVEIAVKEQIDFQKKMSDDQLAVAMLKGRIVRCVEPRDELPFHHVDYSCFYCIYGREPQIDPWCSLVVGA